MYRRTVADGSKWLSRDGRTARRCVFCSGGGLSPDARSLYHDVQQEDMVQVRGKGGRERVVPHDAA
jgi:hypothetical protein